MHTMVMLVTVYSQEMCYFTYIDFLAREVEWTMYLFHYKGVFVEFT